MKNNFNFYEEVSRQSKNNSNNIDGVDAEVKAKHSNSDNTTSHVENHGNQHKQNHEQQETATHAEAQAQSLNAKTATTTATAIAALNKDYVHVLEHPQYLELQQKLTEAEQAVSKHWQDLLMAQADLTNFQRRAERDISNAHKYSLEKMALELLVVVDNLERCLESKVSLANLDAATGEEVSASSIAVNNIYTGVELTLKMFLEVLQKFGIKQFNPLRETFDPELHTAMAVREEPGAKPNSVLQVIQKGYMLKDRLLRPALVIVAQS